MRLEPLYRAVFTTPESWTVDLGAEGQSFLVAEGRTEGRIAARLRGANYPRRRFDGALVPDFRGALETDDGATVLFEWHGYLRPATGGPRQLVGSVKHLSDAEEYRSLNDAVCTLAGEVRPREGGGHEVVYEVAELVWERPA